MIHQISAEHLTIEQVGEIIYNNYKIELSEDAKQRIKRCRNYLDKKIARNGERSMVSPRASVRCATCP